MQLISHSMHRWIDRIAVVPTFLYGLSRRIPEMFQESRFVLHTVGKLRRLVLVHWQKRYVQQQLSARLGACRQCGTCCNLLFTCPMLTKQGHCLVYGKCRPQACKVFPIDQRDIDEVTLCNAQCGFYFSRDTGEKIRKIGRC
ncbi:hypothetical protein FCL47_03200 [Desulfopila sp. IMCC35006]|uniref:hypothetical protein n=1 Tax=Desulfopila sp. IMCC35006 TaxID=2569542 RepID=UPI0010ACFC0F|nr:hypothetical protein [Desulfopila sp. IMCC35006]TKB28504.1 hypothetical protein FCL47_03200 [Desulfopila sp. IMCC35006]